MKSKNKSIIASFVIIITTLILAVLSIISIMTPNLSKEIKKDLSKGMDNLCKGNVKEYYNIYNTRKLTEIEKTKFYEKISSTQDVINSEKDLFKQYKLNIQIKDVSIIEKIGDNLYLCNINVTYKSRKNIDTTEIESNNEDFIVKVIDVGDMDYKILLPFNSLDKDFSSSKIFKKLEEAASKKQADKIKEEREREEKEKEKQEQLELENQQENQNSEEIEHDAQIIEDSSNLEENINNNNDNDDINNSNNYENETNNSPNENINQNTNSNNEENSDKSSYESFLDN